MKIQIFSKVGVMIQQAMASIVTSLQATWVTQLVAVAQVSITLYIVVVGYSVYAGKIQTPFKDLLWNLAKFGLILAFISNAGGYLTLVNEAIDGLKGFFAGGDNSFSLLDGKLEAVTNEGKKIWKSASGIKDSVIAVFRLTGLLPLLLGFLTAGAMLIYTEITLKILIATAPIFIFCLMWGFLRDSFNNWLSAIISNCLIILFTNVTMQVGFMLAAEAVKYDKDFLVPLVMFVSAGVLTMMSVKWGREMALNIGRVSVDAGIGGKSTTSIAERWLSNKKGR